MTAPMRVVAPAMTAAQEQGWLALMEMAARMPSGWCLVGGQMVHLHCWERGAAPQRPTDDLDAVLDIRAEPQVMLRFTTSLLDLGFEPAGESMEGHQHRWVREAASIDILLPRSKKPFRWSRGITGGTTIQAPGAQQALDRAEPVEIAIGQHAGRVLRPRLLGALVIKAAALATPGRAPDRHVADFAVLASLASRNDYRRETIRRRDRMHLSRMMGELVARREVWVHIAGAEEGVDRLRLAVGLSG